MNPTCYIRREVYSLPAGPNTEAEIRARNVLCWQYGYQSGEVLLDGGDELLWTPGPQFITAQNRAKL